MNNGEDNTTELNYLGYLDSFTSGTGGSFTSGTGGSHTDKTGGKRGDPSPTGFGGSV